MSYQATAWALRIKTGSPTLKAVLLAIANYADEDGACWPSQKRLAEDTELTDRAVRGALAALEERGIISRVRRQTEGFKRQSDVIKLDLSFVAEPPSSTLIPEPPSGTIEEPPSGIIAEPDVVSTGTTFRVTTIEPPLEEDSVAGATVACGNTIAPDYDKLLFDEGKKFAAGSMIAKLKKFCGGDPVQALEIVRIAAGRSDPLAYLSAAVRDQEKRRDKGKRHLDAIDEASRAAGDYFDAIGVPRL